MTTSTAFRAHARAFRTATSLLWRHLHAVPTRSRPLRSWFFTMWVVAAKKP
jgi:hypothetical protein